MDEKKDLLINNLLVKTLLKSTSDIVIFLDKKLDILVINETAEKFYQWKKSEVSGKNFLDFCINSRCNSPINDQFLAQNIQTEFIQDLKNSNGDLCTINWLITPLQEDINIIVLVGRDSQLKRNNFAHYLDRIIAHTPGSLYWKDSNGRYLGCNDFMVKTSGLDSVNDIIGKTDLDLWPSNALEIQKNDKYVIDTGKELLLEETVKISNGTIMHFTGVKIPLKDENNHIIGVIGNSLDITKLKETEAELIKAKEEADKANSIKSDFIRNMEHDIRTPFSGIWGLADYLWEHETDDNKKELLGDITHSAKELLDYCNNILDFSKIEAGTLPVIAKKFNVKALIESVIIIERPAAKLKNLLLEFDYSNNIPALIIGDEHRLQRILINLISNAIKFTPKGYVKLIVKLATQSIKNEVIVLFTVKDTGIGIPTDKQNFIYEKFTRLNPANLGTYRGIGLGLRVVKQFTEEMKGEIEVISEPDKGSSFTCIFPFKLPLLSDNVIRELE